MSGSSLPEPLSWGDVLRRVWPRHTAKLAARATGANLHTVEAWLKGRFSPTFATCTTLVRASPELRAAVIQLLMEGQPHGAMASRQDAALRDATRALVDAVGALASEAED